MSSSTDQLARLKALLDAGAPVPDDLAEWVLFRLEGLPARDRAISEFIRYRLRGPSLWARCRRFAELAEYGDPDVTALTFGQPISARHVFRLVTAAKKSAG